MKEPVDSVPKSGMVYVFVFVFISSSKRDMDIWVDFSLDVLCKYILNPSFYMVKVVTILTIGVYFLKWTLSLCVRVYQYFLSDLADKY